MYGKEWVEHLEYKRESEVLESLPNEIEISTEIGTFVYVATGRKVNISNAVLS